MERAIVHVEPAPTPVVEVTEETGAVVEVYVEAPPEVVTIEIPGPRGPRGEKGEKGEKGSSTGGDLSHVHIQTNLASVWRMEHNMGRHSTPDVFDTAGTRWFPDITHESEAVAIADFGRIQVAGVAYFD